MMRIAVRRWLMVAFATLLVVRGAAAQNSLPPAAGPTLPTPPAGMPAAPAAADPAHRPAEPHVEGEHKEHHDEHEKHHEEHHEAHEEHHEAHEEHEEHHEEHGCEEGKWFVTAEYLLYQPRRRALDFAIRDPNRDGRPQGNVESVYWEADSGVRVGGGYRLGEHGWEVGTYYTYFRSAADGNVSAPPGGILYATLTHPGFIDAVNTAAASSSLKYQLFDVEIGRHIEAGEDCTVYLSAGGRYAWIDQALNVSYDGISAFQAQVKTPIAFDGPGLRVGGEGEWKVTHNFGLYARAYGSMLTGEFRTRLVETNNAGAAVITQIGERFRKVVPETELGLGLTIHWESVSARIGYDMINWYGLVDSPDFVHDFTNKLSHRFSDLSLDGLTVRLEVGF